MIRARFLAVLTAVTAVAAGCAAAPVTSAGAQPGPTVNAATLEALVDCPQLPALPTARCGQITVPRDRSRPAAGTLDVAFALVPHTDTSRPGLGTIVPNPGGPGTSTVDVSGKAFTEAFGPLLDRRDLLLIDPRGVGRSTQLTCPALDGPARVFASLQRQRQLIGDCGKQLGDRRDEYGSNTVADDIDAVRATLGLDRLDLVGVSYGTYLMPVYAHRFPQHVRTVTLAGAYAVNVDTTGVVGAAAFRRAVKLVCERTGRCSGAQVISDLSALMLRLHNRPDRVDVTFRGTEHRVVLDEWQMTSVAARVFSSRPDQQAQLGLATAAAAARHGNLQPAREFVRSSLLASAEIYSYGPFALSDALEWATSCHDYPRDFNYGDPVRVRVRQYAAQQAKAHDADFAPFSAKAWLTRADYDTGACLNWPADPSARTPFEAGAKMPDVPVLALNGDLDANTPSASGRAAAAQFPHGRFVEIAGAGHTPASTPAGAAAIVTFIRDARN